ncbi:MAG TPA: sulfotransferase, partial [Woeseiaceae bacterium]|nr:sulfotransferase [Woeseiaceae bacterium]
MNFPPLAAQEETDIPDPKAQRDLFDRATARLRAGDAEGALQFCEQGLQAIPGDANLMALAARACLALQRFDVARKRIEETLRLYPDFATGHDVFGDLLLVDRRPEIAAKAYEKALRLDPARAATLAKLDKARQLAAAAAHSPRQAARPAERTRRGVMAYADEIRQAELFMRSGEQDRAERIYRDILRKDPDHVEAARLLAGIAVKHERLSEAEVFLRRAVALAPDYPRAWVDLTNVQRDLDKFDAAIDSAAHVLQLSPDAAESYMLQASVLGVAGRHEEAIDAYRKALALAPDKAGAMCSMAHHLKTIGRRDEAIAQYRAAIAARPDHSEAYWSLANLKTFRFDAHEVQAMEALLATDDLPDAARAHINNALGFEYEARRDYDRAFHHFGQCNAVRRRAEVYDPVDTESTHDRVIELFDAAFLAQSNGTVLEPTPIFIVGLPRSGSTLIEQILASHSSVEGTHELPDLSKAVQQHRLRAPGQQRFPEFLAGMKMSGWRRIGQDYISRTAKYRDGAPYFIDKNPNNFIFAGLLKLAIPNARIINACRHPLDSCLGTFKQLFASGQPFSYDMTELAEYYLQYHRLMEHWHRVMPGF